MIKLTDIVKGSKLLKEYYSAPKELDDRNSAVYNTLIPGSGKSGTIEGEMLRAINKIIYRHENDGDFFHYGYGAETAGPAASFLKNSSSIPSSLKGKINQLIVKMRTEYKDTAYGKYAYKILELILDHIEAQGGEYKKSSEDMLNYESEWVNDEDEDEDEDEDYFR